jgi:hypothetical protein
MLNRLPGAMFLLGQNAPIERRALINCNPVLFAAYTTIWLCASLTLLKPASPVVWFLHDSFMHYFTPVYPDAIQATGPATGLPHSTIDPAL